MAGAAAQIEDTRRRPRAGIEQRFEHALQGNVESVVPPALVTPGEPVVLGAHVSRTSPLVTSRGARCSGWWRPTRTCRVRLRGENRTPGSPPESRARPLRR